MDGRNVIECSESVERSVKEEPSDGDGEGKLVGRTDTNGMPSGQRILYILSLSRSSTDRCVLWQHR